MNNREVIEQVERGYRMAQPSTITYPESKTLPSEVKIAQANVYKVSKIKEKSYFFYIDWCTLVSPILISACAAYLEFNP